MGRLFGTDGVRGVANQELTAELALKLGKAAAFALTETSKRPRVLIGRDTRISGEMLEAALVAGITSVGVDVVLLGVVPTPGVAFLTKRLQASAGVMISASHNPVEDNGIKFFAYNGYKLSDETEEHIEQMLDDQFPRPTGEALGRVYHDEKALNLYVDHLVESLPLDLSGLHVALDCANGAASHVAPKIYRKLGARVSVIHNSPNGVNINEECGSTHPQAVQALVQSVGADVGISHDGDADRVLAVDEQGNLIDGDQILAICGLELLKAGKLRNKAIAATVYSNGGLTEAFTDAGAKVVRTAAGDRYVLEAMVEKDLILGGEQSGHLIFLEHNTTGDGILTALQLLAVMVDRKVALSQLATAMPVYPQILTNVRVRSKDGWENNPHIMQAIEQATVSLGDQGRIFVRPSGTEPLIRVMGEHPEKTRVEEAVLLVAEAIRSEQGA